MIRIVDMRDAISSSKGFAIWDTITDSFLHAGGYYAFDSEADFLELVADYPDCGIEAERVIALLPEWAKGSCDDE